MFFEKSKTLKAIIASARQLGMPEADILIAAEFLEYNEQGLCLDHIATQLSEYNIGITAHFYGLIQNLQDI
jgi:hypothetical protein